MNADFLQKQARHRGDLLERQSRARAGGETAHDGRRVDRAGTRLWWRHKLNVRTTHVNTKTRTCGRLTQVLNFESYKKRGPMYLDKSFTERLLEQLEDADPPELDEAIG